MGGLPTPKPHHLKMFFSNKYIYGQIVRMADGHIVAAASTIEPALREGLTAAGTSASCSAAASRVGEVLAQRAQQAGLAGVHWQRPHGQRYHGKRKALIEALRGAGLPLI